MSAQRVELLSPSRRRRSTAGTQQQPLPFACACPAGYWRDVAVDALLELAVARQQLQLVDEDHIALCAARSLETYRMLVPDGPKPDDPRNDPAFWRAKWRLRLAGEDV
jgi:hypothetical protein